ncbi:MAG TPA: YceI family protein [Candidatus Xenobia bacterium]|nr:YceI family protein [Candidatus Xenobia bacterium]
MSTWTFEPGHSAAEFRCKHMMVTWVRGHFKNVRGTMRFDPGDPAAATVEASFEAASIWTGEPDRDAHLRSADFLDAANHATITFKSTSVTSCGPNEYRVAGNLTLRGVTRPVLLDVTYLGQWQTPFWVGNEDKGPVTRAGFVAETRINRHDFGVSWNGALDHGGIVVGDEVFITLDIEALQDKL